MQNGIVKVVNIDFKLDNSMLFLSYFILINVFGFFAPCKVTVSFMFLNNLLSCKISSILVGVNTQRRQRALFTPHWCTDMVNPSVSNRQQLRQCWSLILQRFWLIQLFHTNIKNNKEEDRKGPKCMHRLDIYLAFAFIAQHFLIQFKNAHINKLNVPDHRP